jgi:hypothetical protein
MTSMDLFDQYAVLFGQTQDSQAIYRVTKADGLDGIACLITGAVRLDAPPGFSTPRHVSSCAHRPLKRSP